MNTDFEKCRNRNIITINIYTRNPTDKLMNSIQCIRVHVKVSNSNFTKIFALFSSLRFFRYSIKGVDVFTQPWFAK